MSIPITDTVLRAGDALDLTLGERALLLALAFRADDSGAVTATRTSIARQIGQPRSNAQRLFAGLAAKDLIATRGKVTFINSQALEEAAQKVIITITQSYNDDNRSKNQSCHHDNNSVITTITKSCHHDNPINKQINSALIERARAEGLDDFLTLYPKEKRDANTKEELAPIFLDCLKETTKHGLLRALEEQKQDRQWTEAKGRYISTPLNWLARKAFRKFLPDTAAETRAAERQAEESELDALNRAAEEDAGDDYARIQSINEDNTISAFHARRRLAALKIAVDRRAPTRILRRLASEAAIGLQIIDSASAKLPDTITVAGEPVAIATIRAIVHSILQPRKAAQ